MSFIPEGHLVPLNMTGLDGRALGKKKKNPQTSKIRLHICGRANVSAYAGNLKVMTESNVGKKSESNHENIRNWVLFCLFQIFSKRLSTWTLTMLVLE